ncbi:3 beta-hydroxysteroid dehydrogenase-delta 5-_4 isomerase [Hypsugopox virus]|nr:3 beta-hydroxysteroid dehydrogenase-delta 5->4 isomerase [Hypsugopox virus]
MTVYAVTGGNGFIGRAIVQTIIDYDKTVSEILVLDTVHNVSFNTTKSSPIIKTIVCDVTNKAEFSNAIYGVDVLIHCAAIVDVFGKYHPDIIYRVNYHGTKNAIAACIEADVTCLVYTSSMEAVGPNAYGDEFRGNEYSYYNSFHTHPYPKSKQAAEHLILSANGIKTKMGYVLQTCALRPTGVYGEGCEILKRIYKNCKKHRNKMHMTIVKGTIHSRVYVKNVAWMHLLVAKELLNENDNIAGNVYYCYDDSYICEYDEFNLMILEYLNIKKGKRIPIWILKCIAKTSDAIQKMCKPFMLYTPMLNSYTLKMANTFFDMRTNRAELDFNYRPLVSFEDAIVNTVNWLKHEVDGE